MNDQHLQVTPYTILRSEKMRNKHYVLLVLIIILVTACSGQTKELPIPTDNSIPDAAVETNKPVISTEAKQMSTRELAETMFPSTALIVMEDENRQPFSQGSGFVVADNWIVTNHHVIEGADGGYIKIVGQEKKYEIDGYVSLDSNHDLALLNVTGLQSKPLTINDKKVVVGDKLYVIGNPLGLEGTLSEGIVSGLREFGEDSIVQISAPISPGSSGGPVFNEIGELIGVAVATLTGGQNLNFAIPSRYVNELIENAGDIIPLSKQDDSNEESFLKQLESDKPTDGVIGENFLWENQVNIDGDFTYSLRNTLRNDITNVHVLIIFYDESDNPLDVFNYYYTDKYGNHPIIIQGGLAKRLNGSVDSSVKKLTTKPAKDNQYLLSETPYTKVEIRVLGFDILY